jgi:hypothetical protein
MSAQLRPVARMEREVGSILRVEDIDVGVRMMYSYLLTHLQLYIHDKPYSQFTANLRLAGRMSRDPKLGSGFVKLYYDRIEIPTRDWEAVERGEDAPTKTETISFNPDTTHDLMKICGSAHQYEAKQMIRQLTSTLRAYWFSDSSIVEVSETALEEMLGDHQVELQTARMLQEWVVEMLKDTHNHENRSQPI